MVSSGSGNSIKVAAERGLPVISGVFLLPGAIELGDQWRAYEQLSADAGHSVNRDDWRLSANIYLAESTEEAIADITNGAMTEANEYFFQTGGKPTFEAYPGQPAEEISLQQIIEKRSWIIGDPDYCVQRLKELEATTGGFGRDAAGDGRVDIRRKMVPVSGAVRQVRDASVQRDITRYSKLLPPHGRR